MVLRVVLGVYQSFDRRLAGAGLNVCASVLEACFAFHMLFNLGWGLEGLGIASIAASTVIAALGLLASPFFQPAEARGRVKFFQSTPILSHMAACCFTSK